jgi:hypothetical protein
MIREIMSEKAITYDRIREALISAIPELNDHIESTLGTHYDLKIETPDTYIIFEDVVQKLVFKLLEHRQDERLLLLLFRFFEEMANSPDPNVSRDLLGIAIIEPLVWDEEIIRQAWQYLGPRTREFAWAEARMRGLLGSVPTT